MSTEHQPLEAPPLVALPRDSQPEAPHRETKPYLSDAEVKAYVLAQTFAALHQALHGGPGPLGVKGGR